MPLRILGGFKRSHGVFGEVTEKGEGVMLC